MNNQSLIVAVGDNEKVFDYELYGERYSSNQIEAVSKLNKRISKRVKFYDATLSFQKEVNRKKV